MALAPNHSTDSRRLTPRALTAIERDVGDYGRQLEQPRRTIRRLLDHIDVLTETLEGSETK